MPQHLKGIKQLICTCRNKKHTAVYNREFVFLTCIICGEQHAFHLWQGERK